MVAGVTSLGNACSLGLTSILEGKQLNTEGMNQKVLYGYSQIGKT